MAGSADKPDHEIRIFMALRRIIRAVEIHSRKLASEFRITSPQLVCLLAIGENDPISAAQIARQVHLSPSTVVGILDRLEMKNLLTRSRDTRDRRVVNIRLTSEGRELLDNAPSPLQDRLAEALEDLNELEQTTIALSLERIVDLMEAGKIDAAPMLQTGPIHPEDAGKEKDRNQIL
jgi:DNA-binding MarR family transcriptional regulator